VVLERLGSLANLYEQEAVLAPRKRVLIAVGVDEGFGGEQGFELRLLMPTTPWISITRLPQWSITPKVLHAFANPKDPEGLLAVADVTTRRVPIHGRSTDLHRRLSELEHGEDLKLVFLRNEICRTFYGQSNLTSLVLVSSVAEAKELTQLLTAQGVPTHDATEWGRANEGWRLLQDPPHSLVVIRTSLPFWAPVPQLHAAFVARNIGVATLGRLLNILGRETQDKEFALLCILSEYLNQNRQNDLNNIIWID
jgi:hypothetical protein